MTTPATPPEATTAMKTREEFLRSKFPFKRNRGPNGEPRYRSADGAWTCERDPATMTWTMTNAETGARETGLPHIMAARSYLLTLAGASAPPSAQAAPEKPKPEEKPEAAPRPNATLHAVKRMMADLNARFFERREIIEGVVAAMLVGEHVLMLGDPGTAKSALARAIASAFGGTFFERLMTKQSKPDDLFGPPSLAALKADRFERATDGYLPTVHFGFVDETFKGSSAILNNLLTIMQERIFHNGPAPIPCPLITLFGASNEMPESKELDALYDRFLVRFAVGYIQRDSAFLSMLDDASDPGSQVQLSMDVLRAAQAEVAAVTVTKATTNAVLEIRNALKGENIVVSDRRYKKILKLVRAIAWLDGESETSSEHLAHVVDALWAEPKQRPKIVKIVGQFADGTTAKCDEMVRGAEDVADRARQASRGASGIVATAQALASLRDIQVRLETMKKANGRKAASRIEQAMVVIAAIEQRVKAAASTAAGL